MTELRHISRALISVSDKKGLDQLAAVLGRFGVEIISTGGTASYLRNIGVRVKEVSELTGFPEMMNGRVKTLHPRVHGAFLALRDNEEHLAAMRQHGIEAIDLVVVNLYPFEQTIEQADVTLEEAIENIDIGGPAMIRSAAKNWRDVAVVTDPAEYGNIENEMTVNGGAISLGSRRRLAAAAYARTAEYDRTIAEFLSHSTDIEPESDSGDFKETITLELEKISDLRYGENPHQQAALYSDGESDEIAGAEQLHGKEMSFNNYVDADAAWSLVNDIDETAVAIIKHTNPSGVGIGPTELVAYERALSTDPVSAFGGIVAFNRKVGPKAASAVIEVFSEVIIAPDYDDEALQIFKSRKNLRVLRINGGPSNGGSRSQSMRGQSRIGSHPGKLEYKQIAGGFLIQQPDMHHLHPHDLTIVTKRRPTEEEIRSMLFAWVVSKHVKSNAIVLANQFQTIGVGAGQMNRVDSIRIAAIRAERHGHDLAGSALASDAFFPFRDNVDEAAKCGVTAIIQPGGSLRDEESIAAADTHNIAMAFTGIRHFKH
jgi:phosphoribosylaminoimidazolecarboxamide formyltransferase/IMP cyclohydrolase